MMSGKCQEPRGEPFTVFGMTSRDSGGDMLDEGGGTDRGARHRAQDRRGRQRQRLGAPRVVGEGNTEEAERHHDGEEGLERQTGDEFVVGQAEAGETDGGGHEKEELVGSVHGEIR